jgi:hypothetical protein
MCRGERQANARWRAPAMPNVRRRVDNRCEWMQSGERGAACFHDNTENARPVGRSRRMSILMRNIPRTVKIIQLLLPSRDRCKHNLVPRRLVLPQ